MNLALFDLDNTLLNGDSDHIWGVFLAEMGVVDPIEQVKAQDNFYQQYKEGVLDIHAFLEFQFTPLKENSLEQLESWRADYIESHIKPLISQERIDLVKRHQDNNDETIVITATNSFITRPIVDLFGIEHLIATEPEKNRHGFTGKLSGVPCFQTGKIIKLEAFLAENFGAIALNDCHSWFYSDSHNDLPLLQKVTQAIAVTPDEKLRKYAIDHQWQIID